MSLELVKSYYDNFNKKNIEGILGLCTDDVINDTNQGDTQVGKECLEKFLLTAWNHFDESVYDLDIMTNSLQTNIATEYLVKGQYYRTKNGLFPANNQTYQIYCTALFKFRDGKISRITRYYNVKKWLDMVNPK